MDAVHFNLRECLWGVALIRSEDMCSGRDSFKALTHQSRAQFVRKLQVYNFTTACTYTSMYIQWFPEKCDRIIFRRFSIWYSDTQERSNESFFKGKQKFRFRSLASFAKFQNLIKYGGFNISSFKQWKNRIDATYFVLCHELETSLNMKSKDRRNEKSMVRNYEQSNTCVKRAINLGQVSIIEVSYCNLEHTNFKKFLKNKLGVKFLLL